MNSLDSTLDFNYYVRQESIHWHFKEFPSGHKYLDFHNSNSIVTPIVEYTPKFLILLDDYHLYKRLFSLRHWVKSRERKIRTLGIFLGWHPPIFIKKNTNTLLSHQRKRLVVYTTNPKSLTVTPCVTRMSLSEGLLNIIYFIHSAKGVGLH